VLGVGAIEGGAACGRQMLAMVPAPAAPPGQGSARAGVEFIWRPRCGADRTDPAGATAAV